MPFLKPKKISRKKLLFGEEAKCYTFRRRAEDMVERRARRETLFGMRVQAPDVLRSYWVHKFVHLLFPEHSIEVKAAFVPRANREEPLMYSKYVPHGARHLKETRKIYSTIVRAHSGKIEHEKAKKILAGFDKRMHEKHGFGQIISEMKGFGITPKHPEVNLIKNREKTVFAEFQLNIENAKKATKRVKDKALRKRLEGCLERIEIHDTIKKTLADELIYRKNISRKAKEDTLKLVKIFVKEKNVLAGSDFEEFSEYYTTCLRFFFNALRREKSVSAIERLLEHSIEKMKKLEGPDPLQSMISEWLTVYSQSN